MFPRLHPPLPAAAGHSTAIVAQVLDDALAHPSRTAPCTVYAISGVQGSGKSTLAAQLAQLGRQRKLQVVTLSIDDFYLGQRTRQQLGRSVHPLLATRGPPGTHDVALACEVLDQLRQRKPTRLPRFDKIADRRLPPSRCPWARDADLVVFEGWFLKTPAQAAPDLRMPINTLEREQDHDGVWRTYCNTALGRDYPQLWARLDRLLLLQSPGFDVVPGWRWQQEQTLQAANPGRQAMTRAQVERFVQLFERVSRQALHTLPAIAERTLRLDAQRRRQ